MLNAANRFALSMKSGLDEAANLMGLTPKQARVRVLLSTVVIPAALIALAFAR